MLPGVHIGNGAIIGAGSVGSFYGARLARCGHDVRFLMRRDLEAVRRNGLTIRSCEGDFHLDAQAFGDPAEKSGRVMKDLIELRERVRAES